MFLTRVAAAAAGAAAMPLLAQQTSADTPRRKASVVPGPSLADTLAQYATSVRYEDLPTPVVGMVKRVMIDTLGCAIGGYSALLEISRI